LAGAVLTLALLVGGAGAAQTVVPSQPPGADAARVIEPISPVRRAGPGGPAAIQDALSAPVNYADWEATALRAESATANPDTGPMILDQRRKELVAWRQTFSVAQTVNATRIDTLRTQIAALGPVPEEGAVEAPEIAQRRTELAEQLVRLQAPGLAADEAYTRADGLIREIDRVLRERQASAMLQLWPSPLNPANWPDGARALRDTGLALVTQPAVRARRADTSAQLLQNLPVIGLSLLLALLLLVRGPHWIDRLVVRLQARTTERGRDVWALLASLGQIVIPTLGVVGIAIALTLSGVPGPFGDVLVRALPGIGFMIFAAAWLAGQMFSPGPADGQLLRLPPERQAEGRIVTTAFGLLLGVEAVRMLAMDAIQPPRAGVSVVAFPLLVIGGFLLVRMGNLLMRHTRADTAPGEPPSYRNRLIGLTGQALGVIGFAGPLLGAVGYIPAAQALLWPAALSVALVAILVVLQRLVTDIYAALTWKSGAGREALIPVLIGFALTLASLPLFALVWGARLADLSELWTRFLGGFQLGETRISPTNFLVFAGLFAIGYMVTRAFQGALRTSILPKTRLDQGGQNAIVAGTGYIGIFLAGLIAINSAGIDLSGLAIVAGALSVGIGFGLQNIVSNFVSGIILLIERPVSEGDWIEVGNVQGIVRSISVRSTRIQTFDRNDVIVPNTDLVAGRVTNWTRFNLSGRLIVPVSVPLTADSRAVERILREITESQPMAVLAPPPLILFMGFGAEVMTFEIRVILRDVNFSVSVRSEINHQIAARFAQADIQFSSAHRDFVLREAAEREALRLEAYDMAASLDALRQTFDATLPPPRPTPAQPEPAP